MVFVPGFYGAPDLPAEVETPAKGLQRMIGELGEWFPFNRTSVHANAPNSSGVYVLFCLEHCLYVGQTEDIQARLLQHLAENKTCIAEGYPLGFQFELSGVDLRMQRYNELTAALNPACK